MNTLNSQDLGIHICKEYIIPQYWKANQGETSSDILHKHQDCKSILSKRTAEQKKKEFCQGSMRSRSTLHNIICHPTDHN